MPIIAKDVSGDFAPAPEGSYTAVCCDVIDKGMVEDQYGKRHRVQVRWQLSDDAGVMPNGKPWLIVKTYTLSLNEKATLRKDLEAWRGKKFTAEELQGFDVEKVLGVSCIVLVLHNTTDNGRVFANVNAIMPLPRGSEKLSIRDYARVEVQAPSDEEAAW